MKKMYNIFYAKRIREALIDILDFVKKDLVTDVTRLCGSPSWTRTNDPAVNSRMLYRLSY